MGNNLNILKGEIIMTFVECDAEFVERRTKKNLKVYFKEFMCSNIKTAKVEFNEWDYKNSAVASRVLWVAAKRHGFPIKVHKNGDEVYLIRTDI